ncbi:hypothetical protein GCM10011351_28340 [Paraliobacillus quinghaiensis]|uniref:Uncharacterized protein n=1 Tax=Paraliobacillus quinghaiensis TaxID=470815 RepID=A0A917TVW7_9BACI|nr:hypothetical protein [Paraliobacillus quinghaiensis]GGM40505.1 hypothetical protein GCM10011351_28340 [Paraliobacillus quinghaiensis]
MADYNNQLDPYQLSQSISKEKVMEHLDKIVYSLGYENNHTKPPRTWIELYNESEFTQDTLTLDKQHFEGSEHPKVGDHIYLFNKESLLCDSKYTVIDINNVNNTNTLVFKLQKNYSIENAVNLDDFLKDGRVSRSLKDFFSRETMGN